MPQYRMTQEIDGLTMVTRLTEKAAYHHQKGSFICGRAAQDTVWMAL